MAEKINRQSWRAGADRLFQRANETGWELEIEREDDSFFSFRATSPDAVGYLRVDCDGDGYFGVAIHDPDLSSPALPVLLSEEKAWDVIQSDFVERFVVEGVRLPQLKRWTLRELTELEAWANDEGLTVAELEAWSERGSAAADADLEQRNDRIDPTAPERTEGRGSAPTRDVEEDREVTALRLGLEYLEAYSKDEAERCRALVEAEPYLVSSALVLLGEFAVGDLAEAMRPPVFIQWADALGNPPVTDEMSGFFRVAIQMVSDRIGLPFEDRWFSGNPNVTENAAGLSLALAIMVKGAVEGTALLSGHSEPEPLARFIGRVRENMSRL